MGHLSNLEPDSSDEEDSTNTCNHADLSRPKSEISFIDTNAEGWESNFTREDCNTSSKYIEFEEGFPPKHLTSEENRTLPSRFPEPLRAWVSSKTTPRTETEECVLQDEKEPVGGKYFGAPQSSSLGTSGRYASTKGMSIGKSKGKSDTSQCAFSSDDQSTTSRVPATSPSSFSIKKSGKDSRQTTRSRSKTGSRDTTTVLPKSTDDSYSTSGKTKGSSRLRSGTSDTRTGPFVIGSQQSKDRTPESDTIRGSTSFGLGSQYDRYSTSERGPGSYPIGDLEREEILITSHRDGLHPHTYHIAEYPHDQSKESYIITHTGSSDFCESSTTDHVHPNTYHVSEYPHDNTRDTFIITHRGESFPGPCDVRDHRLPCSDPHHPCSDSVHVGHGVPHNMVGAIQREHEYPTIHPLDDGAIYEIITRRDLAESLLTCPHDGNACSDGVDLADMAPRSSLVSGPKAIPRQRVEKNYYQEVQDVPSQGQQADDIPTEDIEETPFDETDDFPEETEEEETKEGPKRILPSNSIIHNALNSDGLYKGILRPTFRHLPQFSGYMNNDCGFTFNLTGSQTINITSNPMILSGCGTADVTNLVPPQSGDNRSPVTGMAASHISVEEGKSGKKKGKSSIVSRIISPRSKKRKSKGCIPRSPRSKPKRESIQHTSSGDTLKPRDSMPLEAFLGPVEGMDQNMAPKKRGPPQRLVGERRKSSSSGDTLKPRVSFPLDTILGPKENVIANNHSRPPTGLQSTSEVSRTSVPPANSCCTYKRTRTEPLQTSTGNTLKARRSFPIDSPPGSMSTNDMVLKQSKNGNKMKVDKKRACSLM